MKAFKVAHVTATFPPYWAGTGNVAYHNARLLHERGHQVTVFTAQTPKDREMGFPFGVERLPAVFRVGNAPFTPSLLGRLGGFDLIHLHYPYILGAELTVLAARRTRTPVVLTYHNDLLAGGLRGKIFQVYSALNQRWVLRSVTQPLGTSLDYARNSLFGRTTPDIAKVQPLPNGVDTGAFTPAEPRPTRVLSELGVPLDRPVVLFVGGMDAAHHFKGVRVLIEAMAGLEGVHAVLVGEGELRPEYEALAQRVAAGRVHFAGKRPLEDLVELYQSATATTLPSTTQGEAFGMVLIESLACGTPVVASNLPGVRTVVEDGQDGFLAEPGDAAGLAQALGKLTRDPAEARRMGLRGAERVKRLYDWEVVGDRLEAIYAEVLKWNSRSS